MAAGSGRIDRSLSEAQEEMAMKRSNGLVLIASALVLAVGTSLQAFQAPPQPTAHHEHFKKMVGAWDVAMTMVPAPGAPAMETKATAVHTLGPGGLWVLGEFKCDMGGMPFTGHSIDGFDPVKNKHTSVWIDSMSPMLNIGEGTCENDCRKQKGTIDGVGMDGKPSKMRYTSESKDDDHANVEMFATGPDGKEYKCMSFVYTRKKA
jgi:hypothetical protein